jgi:uncharacterized membrane-anchored protein YhcB (DUF1043 family)
VVISYGRNNMAIWIAFGLGLLIGFCIGVIIFSLLSMAGRNSRDMENFESALARRFEEIDQK